MMSSSKSLPKEFEKTTEVLPFTKYGLSSSAEFRKAEEELEKLELLKKADLTPEEIKLYRDNQEGNLDQHKIIGPEALNQKLVIIEEKITKYNKQKERLLQEQDRPSTSKPCNLLERLQNKPLTFYPEGHPMNQIKELDGTLFGHLNTELLPLNKRRKILRRFERKKERMLSQNKLIIPTENNMQKVDRPGSLWDLKDIPVRSRIRIRSKDKLICLKKPVMYTVKNKKIMRLEPLNQEENVEDFRAVDIVMPINPAEAQLLEGTKMSIDDIKKIERFRNYEPGIPSKVLYLKNIAPSVTQQQISVLFNQFVLDNGGPIDVRLMTGRMRGQAFVAFRNENTAIQALQEINGTIVSGRPIIAQFGRHTNRIQFE